jgi:hypothetical protein
MWIGRYLEGGSCVTVVAGGNLETMKLRKFK